MTESVLLTTVRPLDAAGAGRALARLYGLSPQDATRRARYCGGILLDAVPPPEAEACAAALAAEGIGARRVPAGALPALGKPRRVVRVEIEDGGLVLGLGLGQEMVVAPDEPRLLLACAVDEEIPAPRGEPEGVRRRGRERAGTGTAERDPETLLAGEDTGLDPLSIRLISAIARRRRDERRAVALGLDLVLDGPRLYRIRRDDLESVRVPGLSGRAPHSVEAFLALSRAASARLGPQALRPPENAALLEAGLIEPALFTYWEELARYERWLLAPG